MPSAPVLRGDGQQDNKDAQKYKSRDLIQSIKSGSLDMRLANEASFAIQEKPHYTEGRVYDCLVPVGDMSLGAKPLPVWLYLISIPAVSAGVAGAIWMLSYVVGAPIDFGLTIGLAALICALFFILESYEPAYGTDDYRLQKKMLGKNSSSGKIAVSHVLPDVVHEDGIFDVTFAIPAGEQTAREVEQQYLLNAESLDWREMFEAVLSNATSKTINLDDERYQERTKEIAPHEVESPTMVHAVKHWWNRSKRESC